MSAMSLVEAVIVKFRVSLFALLLVFYTHEQIDKNERTSERTN